MATSLAEVRRRMLELGPEDMGAVYAPSSLTTTTVMVSALATGAFNSQKYRDYYILRSAAASAADRVRRVSSFTPASGTLTHAGANYSDTTVGTELVELWKWEPRLVDESINAALQRCRVNYPVELPALNSRRHWLHELDWIEAPSDIKRIEAWTSPQLSRNRYFDTWSEYSAAGLLTPDFWAVSGTSATMTRATRSGSRTKYTVILLAAGGNDALMTQNVGLLDTGVGDDTLKSKTVTAVIRCQTSVASGCRVTVDDGVTTTSSSYHTGGGGWEELTAEHTVSATATKLDIEVEMNEDGTAYLDECYLVRGQASDAARRDDYERNPIFDAEYEQTRSLPVVLPRLGTGAYRVWSTRAYPAIPEALLRAGSADALIIDAPRDTLAIGALAHLYQRIGKSENPDRSQERGLGMEWEAQFVEMALDDRYEMGTSHGAAPERPRRWAAPVMSRW